MMALADWAQRIVTFRAAGAAELLIELAGPYKAHMVLGMTIFLVFPFTPPGPCVERFGTGRLPGAAPTVGALAPPDDLPASSAALTRPAIA